MQKILDAYYEEYTYENLVNDLKGAKEVGDEFTLMVASKWLCHNITVITSKKNWSVYNHCSDDIVITYKGKDRYGRRKWTSSQLLSHGTSTRNKTASKLKIVH